MTMRTRSATVKRATRETSITVDWKLDGSGQGNVKTGIPFLDHMLAQLAKHGLFDLKIQAKGDLEVDYHHTVEDIGLTLGEALEKALGDKAGIRRYGSALVPMDETLGACAIDFGGRPAFVWRGSAPAMRFWSRERLGRSEFASSRWVP